MLGTNAHKVTLCALGALTPNGSLLFLCRCFAYFIGPPVQSRALPTGTLFQWDFETAYMETYMDTHAHTHTHCTLAFSSILSPGAAVTWNEAIGKI